MDARSISSFWFFLTRLGEAQIVLPLALVAVCALLRHSDSRALALRWMALLAVAIALTTVSKLAFIGWGIGWPALDFTGISGHAMFASAVYPLLMGSVFAAHASPGIRKTAIAAGFLLSLLIGISRLVIGVHSASEVLSGLFVGGMASALVLGAVHMPRSRIGPVIPAVVVFLVALMPTHAPASVTHPAVVRLALMLSGNKAPFTRADMLRRLSAPSSPV